MKNHRYRSIEVKELDVTTWREEFQGQSLILGLDVAKTEMYAGLGDPEGTVHRIVHWTHPEQTETFFEIIHRLKAKRVTMVLESTGTYGDPLVARARKKDWRPVGVQPKRVKDASEVYDGVPSQHDPKAASVLVWLHTQGLSRPIRERSRMEKELKAHVEPVQWLRQDKHRYQQRLSAKLAKYWPEATKPIALDSATLLGLLEEYGGPREIAKASNQARTKMRKLGCGRLKEETIEEILESARKTVGEPLAEANREALSRLAGKVNDLRCERRKAKRTLTTMIREEKRFKPIRRLGDVVGDATGAMLWVELGDIRNYKAPDAMVKALGLNLKERSSGTQQGQLKITKRGSSKARELLYLATWRKINNDPWFGRWHEKKVQREGGTNKNKSVVALMRKLAKGLWHVGQGKKFQSAKLFADDLLEDAA